MISGCLYSQKYRYTTSNLRRWPLPNIDRNQALMISDMVDRIMKETYDRNEAEEKIDAIVYDSFGLTENEILQIEKFIDCEREK